MKTARLMHGERQNPPVNPLKRVPPESTEIRLSSPRDSMARWHHGPLEGTGFSAGCFLFCARLKVLVGLVASKSLGCVCVCAE